MLFQGLLFILILNVASNFAESDLSDRNDGRIVGGYSVNITDYPYQISLELNGLHHCGGSILSRMWILTAAHCVNGKIPWRLSVRAGSSIRESGGQVKRVLWYFKHPRYSSSSDDYDYALLRLVAPLSYGTGVQPISLATSAPATGTTVTVSGWGALQSGATSLPTQLQAVQVNIVDFDQCNNNYNNSLTSRMICAAANGKDSCQGDSGGPLVYVNGSNRQQVGVVSFGTGCAQQGWPGVYSNVAAVQTWTRLLTLIPF